MVTALTAVTSPDAVTAASAGSARSVQAAGIARAGGRTTSPPFTQPLNGSSENTSPPITQITTWMPISHDSQRWMRNEMGASLMRRPAWM